MNPTALKMITAIFQHVFDGLPEGTVDLLASKDQPFASICWRFRTEEQQYTLQETFDIAALESITNPQEQANRVVRDWRHKRAMTLAPAYRQFPSS